MSRIGKTFLPGMRLGYWNDCVWDRKKKKWMFKTPCSEKVFYWSSKTIDFKTKPLDKIFIVGEELCVTIDSTIKRWYRGYSYDCFVPIVDIFTLNNEQQSILAVTKSSVVMIAEAKMMLKEKKYLKGIDSVERASISDNCLLIIDDKRNAWRWQWKSKGSENVERMDLVATDCDYAITVGNEIAIAIRDIVYLGEIEIAKFDENIMHFDSLGGSLIFVSTKKYTYLMDLGDIIFKWNNSSLFGGEPIKKCRLNEGALVISDSENIWLIFVDITEKISQTPILIRQKSCKFDDWCFSFLNFTYRLVVLFNQERKIEFYSISTDEENMPHKFINSKDRPFPTVDLSFMEKFFQRNDEKDEKEQDYNISILNMEEEKSSNYINVSKYVSNDTITNAGRILLRNIKELVHKKGAELEEAIE